MLFIIIILFSKNGVKTELRAYFQRKAAGPEGPVPKKKKKNSKSRNDYLRK